MIWYHTKNAFIHSQSGHTPGPIGPAIVGLRKKVPLGKNFHSLFKLQWDGLDYHDAAVITRRGEYYDSIKISCTLTSVVEKNVLKQWKLRAAMNML